MPNGLVAGILLLTRQGLREEDILEYPIDKYELLVRVAGELTKHDRADFVSDVIASVGGALSGKKGSGATKYIKKLLEDSDDG